jgi:hypothetical protein
MGVRRTARLQAPRHGGRGDRRSRSTSPALAGASVARVVGSAGRPLDPPTRRFMETRYGHDFGHVRVHDDEAARHSADELGARAWTLGSHIAFEPRVYDPLTAHGRALIAHELAHTIQQHGRAPGSAPRLGPAGGAQESEARAASRAVTAGMPATVTPGSAAGSIQREPVADEPSTDTGGGTPAPATGGALGAGSACRVWAYASPGWVSVKPTYLALKGGEPFEFPHQLRVRVDSVDGNDRNVVAKEGRYKAKDADMSTDALTLDSSARSGAECSFDIGKSEFRWGGSGPVSAITHSGNPIPTGEHDLEIPDYQHSLGSKYGDFGTTWFRVGHSGDRYLHPGRVSAGCITVDATAEWPKIYRYLIDARKDDTSVGTVKVT